jgi:hypothetical protein
VNIYVNSIKELMHIVSGAARIVLSSALLISIFAACSSSSSWDGASEKVNRTDKGFAEVELLFCKGQSILPVLLTTGQIDGYVAWQPYLALAEKRTESYDLDGARQPGYGHSGNNSGHRINQPGL